MRNQSLLSWSAGKNGRKSICDVGWHHRNLCKAAGAYHCPADTLRGPGVAQSCASGRVRRMRVVDGSGVGGGGYHTFTKFSNFNGNLAASDCFVFLDENPMSLNDGWFLFNPAGSCRLLLMTRRRSIMAISRHSPLPMAMRNSMNGTTCCCTMRVNASQADRMIVWLPSMALTNSD